MEINKCKTKFKLLFNKFFQENFELSSYYAENLLKYLDDSDDKCAGKLLDTPFFSDLVMYSLTHLEKVTISVQVFILEVFAIAIKNELQFSKLAYLQGFQMIIEKLYKFKSENPPTALHLAGTKAAMAHTFHYSGIMRIVHYKGWTRLMRPNIHKRSKKVAQNVYNLMSQIVWKLNEYDEEEVLIEALAFFINPIRTSEYLNLEVIDIENEQYLYDPIIRYVSVLVAIARDCENNSDPHRVLQLLYRHFILEAPMYMILEKTRNYELVCLLSELQFHFILALCKDSLRSEVQGTRDIPAELISAYYNTVICLLNKRMPSAATYYVVKCVVIWAKADTSSFPETFERHGRTFNLENQFITLILSPILTFALGRSSSRNNLLDEIDAYREKLTKMASEHIVKAAYSFRDLIETSDRKIIVINCLKELFKLKGCLNTAQAGMLFQTLFYTLKHYVISDGSGALVLNENPIKSPDDIKLLSLLLEAIRMLLKEHDITWYENVEIISLQTTLMDMIKLNFMPSKQLLQALDLIDLCVKKFLSPDMALLIESKAGSTLNEVGVIMQSYIQHEEWEVRDSALSLLLSCTDVAFVKYLPLRKLLSQNKLIVLAAHAALGDTEFYVQTTALRCLAAATKIDSLWREVLSAHPNLYKQLIYVLEHNSEGIVRKEAANVLIEICVNQIISKELQISLYNVMATAAINDLHWEVQVAALDFWKNCIQNRMTNRGMIDGKFPSVTFSKEKRKIITLNEKEITNQLIGIMYELTSIGCLPVLHKCLNEEFNVDVIEQAYDIAKELVKILDLYNFEGVPEVTIVPSVTKEEIDNDHTDLQLPDITEYVEEAMDLSSEPTRYQLALRETITRDILNATDYDLIAECYEKCQIKEDDMEEDLWILPQLANSIDTNTFLSNFKKTNYPALIKDKRNWSSGPRTLDLLLDEILALGEMRSDIVHECN